eukprot:CAMPEP_0170232016 /NCGR_PEP_ID=MMETSP0116_2-20130129/15747_1 /TAXON_ID=400756 /ORGANISM="Durinskia baltica, Strain CSIRO CS-38" /LENGTH=239 /DNA_ID=CAMNT_0010482797 /DNA_START=86 /DNA_END=807 /DNA_ORIENTATION=-
MQPGSESTTSEVVEQGGAAWQRYLERRQKKVDPEWQERRRMIARRNQPGGRRVKLPQVRIADNEDTALDIVGLMAPRYAKGQFSSVDSTETGASSRSYRSLANVKAQQDRLMAAPASAFQNEAREHWGFEGDDEDASPGSAAGVGQCEPRLTSDKAREHWGVDSDDEDASPGSAAGVGLCEPRLTSDEWIWPVRHGFGAGGAAALRLGWSGEVPAGLDLPGLAVRLGLAAGRLYSSAIA